MTNRFIILLAIAAVAVAAFIVSRQSSDEHQYPLSSNYGVFRLVVQDSTGAVASVVTSNCWLDTESGSDRRNNARRAEVSVSRTALGKYQEACMDRNLEALQHLYATEDRAKLHAFLQDPESSNKWASFNLEVTRVEPIFGVIEEGRITSVARVSIGTNTIILPYQIDTLGFLRVADFKSPLVGMFLQHSDGVASGRYHLRLEAHE